ncbi:ABC transporter ATP-binding protein [Bombilactobacillus bombi]|uniref:ABC transporter ATP-binding protein n=1 Tax=Bombilactobacillus bombi TaxID=1303590 RepID=UPI0015E5C0B7|nr:ABC transporter ATP-binding protein [Bombilactobacillus bombi]MBA1434735.1 ABC transporter ATP-binding protein [Bombilactobacillus bombi]
MTIAINLQQIHKSFNCNVVLKDISLKVKQGEIIGLLGANGAGKSTLIKIMTGLLKPDAGTVQIFGQSLNKQHVRKYLGLAPQELGIYPQLTVQQNLKSFGALNGLTTNQIKEKYSLVSEIFDLRRLAKQPSQNLSGGQKRRLHSAIALMSQAKVVFLDEPTVGADVDSRNRIIAALRTLSNQGLTIIYTTHYLQEMEDLKAKIVFLNQGSIQASGDVDTIIHHYANPFIELYFSQRLPQIEGWQKVGDHLKSIETEDFVSLLQVTLNNPLVQSNQLTNIKIIRANLEAAYNNLLERKV